MLFCSEVDLIPSLIGEKDALLRFAVFVRDQHGPCARAVGRGAGSSLCARYVRLGLVERLLRLLAGVPEIGRKGARMRFTRAIFI
jgi:hypothetical protein